MKAVVIRSIGQVQLENRPEPEIRPGHVLLRVEAVSICGTDTHIYEGTLTVPLPRIPGHDFAGVVEAVAPGVSRFRVGDRVAVKPSFPCGSCPACQTGFYEACERKQLIGLHSDGCMRERLAVPESNLVPLPPEVGSQAASILEPFTVALNTFQRLKINVGDSVAVLGQGPIGLGQTCLAALSGAGQIIAVDLRDEALEFAREFGATVTLNPRRDAVADRVRELTDGRGADVVIEAAGTAATVGMQLDLVRKEGKVANIGVQEGMGAHDVATLIAKTLTVFGVGGNGGRGQYETAVELARRGLIRPERLVTHVLPLNEAARAFDLASRKGDPVIKIVLDCQAR